MESDSLTYQEKGEIYKAEIKVETPAIHDILLKLGVHPNLHGYTYIVYALELILIDPELLHHVTKGLYIDIAEKFNTTPYSVERGIRHAISTTWLHGNLKYIDNIFQNCIDPEKGVPTNTLFLARLYYYLIYDNNVGM